MLKGVKAPGEDLIPSKLLQKKGTSLKQLINMIEKREVILNYGRYQYYAQFKKKRYNELPKF